MNPLPQVNISLKTMNGHLRATVNHLDHVDTISTTIMSHIGLIQLEPTFLAKFDEIDSDGALISEAMHAQIALYGQLLKDPGFMTINKNGDLEYSLLNKAVDQAKKLSKTAKNLLKKMSALFKRVEPQIIEIDTLKAYEKCASFLTCGQALVHCLEKV